MAELLLVNPKPRSKTKTKTKVKRGKTIMATTKRSTRRKPRTAAQKAATRRLVALNKRRSSITTKTTPAKRRRRRRATTPATVAKRRVARRNPARRNPITTRRRVIAQRGIMGSVGRVAKPAISGAAGAMALDVAMGYLSPMLPAQLQTGPANSLVKGAAAILLGVVAEKIPGVRKNMAMEMSKGALTVVLHNTARTYLKQLAPQVPLAAYEDDVYVDYGMGQYVGLQPALGQYTDGTPSATSTGMASAPQFAMDDGWND